MSDTMTLERALEICQAISARFFLADGITDDPKLPSLKDVSLQEMLTAAAVVRERNAAEAAGGGAYTIFVAPGDRLIAAVYVGVNYDSATSPLVIEPVRGFGGAWSVKAVAVVDVTSDYELQDGKQVAA